MRGLLLKDWYMILRHWKGMIVFNIIYALIASLSSMAMVFAAMNILLGTMVVKSLMAYEEQNRWDCLAVNLPVTQKQIVTEKYLVGFGGALFTSLLTAGIMSLVGVFYHGNREGVMLPNLLLFVALGMLLLSLELPVLFKFGVNKGRIWFMATVILVSTFVGGMEALMGGFGADSDERMIASMASGSALPVLVGAVLIGCAAVFVSIRISLHFYQKREF